MTQKFNPLLRYEFSCPLPTGLHARPASHLAEVANRFLSDCSVTNLRNGLVANAKSVLGVIAADIRHQDRCVLYAFRCAVYYASHTTHDPNLLKWWNWKDR